MPSEGRARPPSLALRATAMAGLATTLILLLFTWTVERSIEGHFAAMDLNALQGAAASVRAAMAAGGARGERTRECLALTMGAGGGVVFAVRGRDGAALLGTAPPALLAAARARTPAPSLDLAALRVWSAGGRVYRGAVLDLGGRDLLVAKDIGFHLTYLARLRLQLWLGALAASCVSVLAAWFAVQRGHAPIRRMSARMREITSERLDVRVDPASVPVELVELVVSFNALLERIERSFQRLSNVSADIAHELRTPVTNLTTQTQVALSRARSADDYREVLYSNLEEYERMAAMIGDMLFLAQTDHGLARIARDPVDLGVEVRGLFEYFDAWAEERGVSLALEGEAPPVRGDRSMLRRALSNLLSNAIRHTPRGQTVTVRLRQVGSGAEVAVENPGAGIAPEHLPRLFERFYRVDPSRRREGDGAGLGLAIVESIAQAHEGAVSVASRDGLTIFTMRLG